MEGRLLLEVAGAVLTPEELPRIEGVGVSRLLDRPEGLAGAGERGVLPGPGAIRPLTDAEEVELGPDLASHEIEGEGRGEPRDVLDRLDDHHPPVVHARDHRADDPGLVPGVDGHLVDGEPRVKSATGQGPEIVHEPERRTLGEGLLEPVAAPGEEDLEGVGDVPRRVHRRPPVADCACRGQCGPGLKFRDPPIPLADDDERRSTDIGGHVPREARLFPRPADRGPVDVVEEEGKIGAPDLAEVGAVGIDNKGRQHRGTPQVGG